MSLMKTSLSLLACISVSLMTAHRSLAAGEPTKEQCVQANELGQSLRQQESLYAARLELLVCLSPACPEVVRQDCKDRIAEIDELAPVHVVETPQTGGIQRVTGMTLTGVGVVGVIVGSVLGFVAKSTYDTALSASCAGAARTCDSAGTAQVNLAHGQAAAATGSVIGGVALLGGGIALWAASRTSVRLAPSTGGAHLELGWAF